MHRLLLSDKKGQWFLISAVIISSILLVISFMLKSYFIVDTSKTEKMDADLYLKSICKQLKQVREDGCRSGEWKDVVEFNKKQLAKKGYMLQIYPENRCTNDFFVNISSGSINVCKSSESIKCAV